ncbi:helix-turn-helix domain-containing protein [uncultured Methylobacterium sp.]|uniref:helix-turn-helix domain-containing protein n=1 Tax=uncultured Methylobacterium sp. TaxID=157278 RepID=UPI0035CAC28A
MKLSPEARDSLRRQLVERVEQSGSSYSVLAAKARVDPSQVSRICRGEFRTMSHNVVQICIALGIDTTALVEAPSAEHPSASSGSPTRIEAILREIDLLWDKTPEDAARIVRLLRDLRELRRSA